MGTVRAAVRHVVAVLGNEAAVANAAALGHQRHRERWAVATLERSVARSDAARDPAREALRPSA